MTAPQPDTYNFSISEVFPDGRVMVCTYVRIGQQISLVMDVYDDQTLQGGRRYLNVQQANGGTLPQMHTPISE